MWREMFWTVIDSAFLTLSGCLVEAMNNAAYAFLHQPLDPLIYLFAAWHVVGRIIFGFDPGIIWYGNAEIWWSYLWRRTMRTGNNWWRWMGIATGRGTEKLRVWESWTRLERNLTEYIRKLQRMRITML
jgi:hypothetical protein